MIDKSKIPDEALYVLNKLKENGFDTFLVGGCVRDLLLNKTPKDFDITTQALPEQVMVLFDHTIPTGISHGTVTAMINKTPIEVTTFRSDGEYTDSRKPDSVKFGVNVQEDVLRRDFTINGLLYDGEKVIDLVFGKGDILNKVIRCIGHPHDIFNDDALRMMRSVRFSCQLDFKIHYVAREGIIENAHLIKNISQERIRDELVKILMSHKPSEGIYLLSKLGLLQYILPELQSCVGFDQYNKHHNKNVFNHILKVLENTPAVLNLRLAALFHDISKPGTFSMDDSGQGHFYSHHKIGADKTREIMKRLKFDNDTINNVCILVYEHMARYPKLREGSVKKLLRRLEEHNVDDLINLQIADIIGSKPPYDFESVVLLKNELKRIIETKEPIAVNQLAINGHDLIELGIKPGKRMGEILNELLQLVMDKPEMNTKDKLLDFINVGFMI